MFEVKLGEAVILKDKQKKIKKLEDWHCKPTVYWQRKHNNMRLIGRPIQLLYSLELYSKCNNN